MATLDLSELDEFAGESGSRCAVALAANALSPKEREVFLGGVENRKYTGAQLARWVRSKSVWIEDGSINRHRRGECRCGR